MKTIVIDAKWYAERVANIHHWIQFAQGQVAWHEEGIASQKEQIEEMNKWLVEALADQEKFLAHEA